MIDNDSESTYSDAFSQKNTLNSDADMKNTTEPEDFFLLPKSSLIDVESKAARTFSLR